jgi:CheY-like chemotaxis protein
VQTILVVDDEFGAVEVVTATPEDEGYRVLSAANGRLGLLRLEDNPVDLVIVDFMMPLMDGAQMAQAMRENPDLRNIPIIMISAVGEAQVRQKFEGYQAFLRKPFRISMLLETVRRLLPARNAERPPAYSVVHIARASTAANRSETTDGICARGSRGCTARRPSTPFLHEDFQRTSMPTLITVSSSFDVVYILRPML